MDLKRMEAYRKRVLSFGCQGTPEANEAMMIHRDSMLINAKELIFDAARVPILESRIADLEEVLKALRWRERSFKDRCAMCDRERSVGCISECNLDALFKDGA